MIIMSYILDQVHPGRNTSAISTRELRGSELDSEPVVNCIVGIYCV